LIERAIPPAVGLVRGGGSEVRKPGTLDRAYPHAEIFSSYQDAKSNAKSAEARAMLRSHEPSETPGDPSVEVRATRPEAATSAVEPVSPVPRPCLSRDPCQDVSDSPQDLAAQCRASIRGAEHVFRDVLGLSRTEAKRLAAGGWSAMARRDGELDPAAVLSALREFIDSLESKR
jgi:hypothetical protein